MHRWCACVVVAIVLGRVAVQATVTVPAEFSELVHGSHLIVHGIVTDVRGQLAGPLRTIESLVTIRVIESVKGESQATAVFRVPGGQVGRYRRVMVGAPQFTEGDEVVVFLAGRPPVVPRPFGLNQGVYRVSRAGAGALVTPLVADAAGRVVRGDPARRPLALEAFTAAIRAVEGPVQ